MIINHANLSAAFVGFKAAFNSGFRSAQPQWGMVASRVPSTAASEQYGWLGQFPRLREWIGDKQFKDLQAYGYALVNKDYESSVEVDRNHLADDQYGFYGQIFAEQGFASAMHPDDLVFTLLANAHTTTLGLAHDGQAFFSTAHTIGGVANPNMTDTGSGSRWYLLGTMRPLKPFVYQERMAPKLVNQDQDTDESVFTRRKYRFSVEARGNAGFGYWQTAYMFRGPLDATNYAAARAALWGMRSDEGRPLNIEGDLLVVPPALEGAANTVVNTQFAAGGNNIWAGTAKVLVSPWLP